MALILSIETATKSCSVALHEAGKLLASKSIHVDKSHSSGLVPMISAVLRKVRTGPSELDAVAVSMGPGSYTGLRIGVSTAKGLCYSHEIPLLAINTLEAMLNGISIEADFYIPMIDARRMEVYSAVFDKHLNMVVGTQPVIVDRDSFIDYMDRGKVVFFGNGSEKCQEILRNPNAIFVDDFEPSAEFMGLLAFEKYRRQGFEDLAYFEPFYLKEFKGTKPKPINLR